MADDSGPSFSVSLHSSDSVLLFRLTDDLSSSKSQVIGRASLKGGKERFLSRNHGLVEIEGRGQSAFAKLIPTHPNPCYVVRGDREDVVEDFWDDDENCELINQKSNGSRDEIFLHEGDEIRFSKDGSRFKFRVERDDLTNEGVEAENGLDEQTVERVEAENGLDEQTVERVEGKDGFDAAADTLLLVESPLKTNDSKATEDENADSWADFAANGGGGGGFGGGGRRKEKDGPNESKDEISSKKNKLSEDEKINEETEGMDFESDYGGDTDVDEDLAELRSMEKPEKEAELEMDRNESPKESPEARETAESPKQPFLEAPENDFRPSTHSQTLATQSQKKDRRLPSWWMELIENEEIVSKKKSRKRKPSFVEEDLEVRDAKRKKHSPQKLEDENAKNKIISSLTTKALLPESKAKPGQKVKSSIRRSDPENSKTGVIETETKRSLPPTRRTDASHRPSIPQSGEKQTQEPSSAMFSRANFGTLMNVLDSDEEEEPSHSERPAPSDARRSKGGSSIKTEAASEDACEIGDADERFDDDVCDKEERFDDDVGEKVNGVVKEELSDRDSWEEMTPPSTPVRGASTPAKKIKTTPMNSNKPGTSTSSAPSSARRKCQYGKDCYRKNPAHFQECCHPDDADWVEDDDDDDDDDDESQSQKPECEFGADCYRKNPQHRLDFRHPKPGDRPSRRAAIRAKNKTKKSRKDEEEEEDGEYESSFINDDSDLDPDEIFDSSSDDSSDGGKGDDDDDDFEIDENDVDEEDEKQLKRLKKEAKKFARK